MAAKEKNILIGPDEGAHLSTLDVTHKVTAENFGGAFTIMYYIGQAKGRRPDKEPRLSLCAHPSSFREDLTPESRFPGIAPLKLFGK